MRFRLTAKKGEWREPAARVTALQVWLVLLLKLMIKVHAQDNVTEIVLWNRDASTKIFYSVSLKIRRTTEFENEVDWDLFYFFLESIIFPQRSRKRRLSSRSRDRSIGRQQNVEIVLRISVCFVEASRHTRPLVIDFLHVIRSRYITKALT